MDVELKTKWIAALRSGSYRQGQAALRSSDDQFCCLGVLCDIAPNVTWEKVHLGYEACLGDESSTAELPVSFRQSVGISQDDEQMLIELNDDCDSSFADIADHIEANL